MSNELAGVVMPQLDGAHVIVVGAAEQGQHRQQIVPREHRHGHATSQARRLGQLGALEVGVLQILEDDGVPRRPGLARQAFVVAEAHGLAAGAEMFVGAVQAVLELEEGSVLGGDPDLAYPNESLHGIHPFSEVGSDLGRSRTRGHRPCRYFLYSGMDARFSAGKNQQGQTRIVSTLISPMALSEPESSGLTVDVPRALYSFGWA
jgi:hypothetical protein